MGKNVTKQVFFFFFFFFLVSFLGQEILQRVTLFLL